MQGPAVSGSFSSGAVRLALLASIVAATCVWVFTAVDDYLYHTPYGWGQWCGETNLPPWGREGCYLVYNYYYSLDAHTLDSGVVATLFLLLSLVCIGLLWLPRLGPARTLVRVLFIVAPAEILAFEVGVYFLLNYWWTIHATEFLSGTPFTNEVVFWVSAAVLAAGLSLAVVDRRSRDRPAPSEFVNKKDESEPGIQ